MPARSIAVVALRVAQLILSRGRLSLPPRPYAAEEVEGCTDRAGYVSMDEDKGRREGKGCGYPDSGALTSGTSPTTS